jgi:WD40 repeat protein
MLKRVIMGRSLSGSPRGGPKENRRSDSTTPAPSETPAQRSASKVMGAPSANPLGHGAAARASGYDAFISYSHALDGKLAPVLQRELERFAKPWNKGRVLRVFRDNASLSANPGLWSAIEEALASSEWFVLMASPEAAQSPWVGREVSWWLANRSPQRLLVVVTGGEFAWDGQAQDVDWVVSTAAPPGLRGAFEEEPRWVDLRWLRNVEQVDRSNPRFTDNVADIASAVRGVPKDLLVGEHIRQERKTKRLTRGAITTLAVLLVAAVVATMFAILRGNEAQTQAQIATARALASTAIADLGTRIDLAQLLAVEAYRMDHSPQTRSALFQAATASPYLVTQTPVSAPVTALAGSADGRVAVAGTNVGRLVRWDLARRTSSEATISNKAIGDIAVSADGRKVVATDAATTVLWDATTGQRPITIEAKGVERVAISPSGQLIATVAANSGRTHSTKGDVLTLLDGQTGKKLRSTEVDPYPGMVGLPDDSTVVLASATGPWQRLSTSALTEVTRSDQLGVPAGNYAAGFSPDAGYVGYVKYRSVSAWSTRTRLSSASPTDILSANVPVAQPEHLAISRNGTYVAVAGGGAFYADTLTKTAPINTPKALSGHGRTEAVAFLGDGPRLVSAADGMLTLWDLSQPSRLYHSPTVDMPATETAGPPPDIAVTPDGTRVAVISHGDFDLPENRIMGSAVHDLSGLTPKATPLAAHSGELPLWNADGSRLLIVGTGGAIQVLVHGQTVQQWPTANDNSIIAAGASADGKRVVLVDADGGVQVRRATDGQVRQSVPAPAHPEASADTVAAVSTDARTVAYARLGDESKGPMLIINIETGRSHQLPGGSATAVAFGDDQLLVQRPDGTLEVWDTAGNTKLHSLPGDAGYQRAFAAIPGTGLVARLRGDGTVVVVDLTSGGVLGSFPLPPMTRGSVAYPWAATVLTAPRDSSELVTATSGGQFVRWRLMENTWPRSLCDSAGRDLTAAEWRNAVGTHPPTNLACRR